MDIRRLVLVTVFAVTAGPTTTMAQETPGTASSPPVVPVASALPAVVPPCAMPIPDVSPEGAGASPAPIPASLNAYCARDLITAPTVTVDARSIGVIIPAPDAFGNRVASSGPLFAEGPCAGAAKVARDDLAMLCLYEVADAWRRWQREYRRDGVVPEIGFRAIVPAYQYARGVLDDAGRRTLDEGLLRLDRTPIDWVRSTPTGVKGSDAVTKAPTKNVDLRRLARKLRAAWLESMTPLLEGDRAAGLPVGYWGPGVPFSYGGSGIPGFGPGGAIGIVNICRVAIAANRAHRTLRPGLTIDTCARAAANAFLMYQATGDDRFLEVAIGLRGAALTTVRALTTTNLDFSKDWNRTFACWLRREAPDGCPTGA